MSAPSLANQVYDPATAVVPFNHLIAPQAAVNFPHEPFAVEIAGTRKEGGTGIYRNAMYHNGTELLSIYGKPEYPKTAYECFEHGLKVNFAGQCLGHRPWSTKENDYEKRYVWQTYSEVAQRRTHLGSGLVHLAETRLGAPEVTGWTVGIWAINRPEWQIVSLATTAYSLVLVSLYETLGPQAVEYCASHSECRVIFASPSHIPTLLSMSDKLPLLKAIVSVDKWEDIDMPNGGPTAGALPKGNVLKAWGESKGILILDITELELIGQANPRAHVPPKPDDMASLCYTSGTTGNPKGAILTHKLLANCVLGQVHGRTLETTDVMLSYLPLSHIFERFTEDIAFYTGSSIGYSCGDNTRLLEDLQTLKPTMIVAVPRVLNKLYQVIKMGTIEATGLRGALSRRAFGTKIANLRKDGTVEHAFWDRILMRKIAAAVGGNLKFIGTGSAAVSPAVLEFLSVAFSLSINEGYGSTENGGTCTKNMMGDYTSGGTVGPPQPSVEIKLADVPELGYFSTDKPYPRGEILCRGEGVIPGYYKDPEKTKESFDEDGFFKTGDVGLIDNLGRLKIIDRVKNLFKLSQGEYVAVEKVENVYSVPSLGAQTLVYADSLQNHLILFVVPDPVALSALAQQVLGKTIDPTDHAALAKAAEDPRMTKAGLAIYNKEAAAQKLNGYETAKQFAFRMTPFSVEEDTLTPTMKIKRNVAYKLLKPNADKLYAEHEAANAGKGGFKAKL